jgi:hypothetical protein
MDHIASSLGMDPCSKEILKEIFNFDEYTHTESVWSFEGWKQGEFTDEHRKNMSIAASKRIRTKDHLTKLHEGRKNSKNSAEHTAVLVTSRLGTSHTNSAKEKMSEKKLINPSTKINASNAGKISAMKRKIDPAYKKLQSERAKAAWARRKEGLVNGD